MNKKKLFIWSLYDFANSFIFINFLLYFSQWLTIEGGLSDFKYNAIFAITSILLLISAPTLASFTDRFGGRKYFLNISTVGTFLTYGLAVILAYNKQSIYLISLFFLLGQYFYQLSFVFYNTLIVDVADEEHRARASGIGQFSNSIGQVCGLVVALFFTANRLQPLVASLIIFIVLSLPMMIGFIESKVLKDKINIKILLEGEKDYFKKMIKFFSLSVAIPILVAYFFFNDAMITVSNNYSIYIERVFSVPDTSKNILLMSVLFMSAIGGIVSGWIADRIGPVKTLLGILFGWVILLPLIATADNFITLSVLSCFSGLLIGSVVAVTRAYLSRVLANDELVYGFSFYTIFERFATLVGPLTWGGVIAFLGVYPNSYRVAMASMVIYIVIGIMILMLWKRSANK